MQHEQKTSARKENVGKYYRDLMFEDERSDTVFPTGAKRE